MPAFPLQASPNRRYLMDQSGAPFLYHADTPWWLWMNYTADEAEAYVRFRMEQGFTAFQVQLTGFLGQTNPEGRLPFGPGHDFGTPDELFFAHVDEVLRRARALGAYVMVAPLWSGCCGEGWAGALEDGSPRPLNANGPEGARELGRWLGERYATLDHVGWILGGDNDPDNARAEIAALAEGLKEAAPGHLLVYHASSSHSSTDVWDDAPWLDLSMIYTYHRYWHDAWNKVQPDVYEVALLERLKGPPMPYFLGESTYEGEREPWGNPVQMRKQAYWALLSGACGHAYGSVLWKCPPDWREAAAWPGADSMRHVRTLFERFDWPSLRPDVEGVRVGGLGPWGTNDRAVAALGEDGAFGLIYVPSSRTLTLEDGLMGLRREWYCPASGQFQDAQSLTPPGPNGAGEPDWVLVLGR